MRCLEGRSEPGEKVVVIGGDNYRIGMGGGAVSSVNTDNIQRYRVERRTACQPGNAETCG